MRSYLPILAFLIATAILIPGMASAQQRLTEIEGMPFSLAIGSRMEARLLPFDDPAGYAAAAVMPPTTAELDIVEVNWPRSKRVLQLSFGRSGRRGGPREQQYTSVSVAVDDGQAQLAGMSRSPLPGTLNRLCIWPTAGSDGDLVIALTLAAAGTEDSVVYCFRVGSGGTVTDIPTGGALSAFGGFEMLDLDNDSSFELVTSRNLDGMPGGFSYHAVRRYDGGAYVADPERFKQSYFRDELEFLEWVVLTREAIMANPEPFMGSQFYGFYYVAKYKNEEYGFDSLIELPATAGGQFDVPSYNRLRAAAYRRVVAYRDELRRWLGGGQLPATWKLSE